MHDVVAGFWTPNAADQGAHLDISFGTTINIINGGIECGGTTQQAVNRGNYYKAIMNYLGLNASSENVSCAGQTNSFPSAGAGAVYTYFDQGDNNNN